MSDPNRLVLTPDLLLQAYAYGIFPMAEDAKSNEIFWYNPPLRGVIPLDQRFHVPSRLRRTIRKAPYIIKLNTAFTEVMRACASPTADSDRQSTWINEEIIEAYSGLHQRGHAHSVEAWQDNLLIGGLYGVSLGAAFFGESMFSRKTDASKIALVHLVSLLRHSGFILLDTQFQTEHLRQFGTIEIERQAYHHLLINAVEKPGILASLSNRQWHDITCNMLKA
jgi:leucyl/phenylalanyl-tRNA--protein transferase